ncbi:MAG: cupredoxin domain-containing protein [Candidatus Sungbacteria bacterium]|uniref:Cupredoxin domain-containing protein n=1 Tax=Candidatus Sungiibacteriota bacterium TaxID=2750080 RepID=A0A931SBC3_9BACT|nr:cupredoxin domain-containing protein [Candidatus Sungbacteria bacterium]
MKKYLIGIIVLIIIVGGLALWISKNSSRPDALPETPSEQVPAPNQPASPTPPPQASDQSAVVTYADSGYAPSILQVKVGTTVTFKNQSSNEMWTASAVHPTHTVYPEFDAKRGYTTGDSYSFTFTRVGSWKYHDHFLPSHTGTIVVKE